MFPQNPYGFAPGLFPLPARLTRRRELAHNACAGCFRVPTLASVILAARSPHPVCPSLVVMWKKGKPSQPPFLSLFWKGFIFLSMLIIGMSTSLAVINYFYLDYQFKQQRELEGASAVYCK